MKHVCAWCRRELPEDDKEPRDKVSHGICPGCYEKVFGAEDAEDLRGVDKMAAAKEE